MGFYVNDDDLGELNVLCKCSNFILHETLMKMQVGLAVDKDHFVYDKIEDTLQRIIPFGIPQHSADYHKWVLYRRNAADEINTSKAFNFSDMQCGFVVWLIACSISILVFACEVLWVHGKRIGREYLGLSLFCVLLCRRLNAVY
jgi:hypothetical protein